MQLLYHQGLALNLLANSTRLPPMVTYVGIVISSSGFSSSTTSLKSVLKGIGLGSTKVAKSSTACCNAGDDKDEES